MPTKSKSPTITKRCATVRKRARRGERAGRRLPRLRPPTHPGEMLLEEFVRPLGITQAQLAARLGISSPLLNEIIRRKRAVTPEAALRLARVLGMSAEFWLGLQIDWELWHAMRGSAARKIAKLEPIRSSA